MLKSAIITSAVLFGAAAPVSPPMGTPPPAADQIVSNSPDSNSVIAQLAYLEINHGDDGFGISIAEDSAVFVDVEFPGNLHIRVGF